MILENDMKHKEYEFNWPYISLGFAERSLSTTFNTVLRKETEPI